MSGWRLEVFNELGSTSDFCVARARAGEPAGLAILALKQTAGRGSRGRQWHAPAGNLNLSLLLRPKRPAAEAGMFALLAGLAVAEVLENFSALPVMLKWPNDVMLHNAKLAGILIDAAPAGAFLEWLAIGIGVNLQEAPVIAGRPTTSLGQHDLSLAPQAVAVAILTRIEYWADAPSAAIRAAWLARAHPLGTMLDVSSSGRMLHGAFAGLTDTGELLLQAEARIHTINTGEILLGSR